MNLLFMNPTFNEGQNVTVRRGVKWSLQSEPELGFPVIDTLDPLTADGKDKIVGFATKTSCKIKRFLDIQSDDIENEHDPVCRTWGGLYDVMQETYPGFDCDEIVTIFRFDYKKVTP